MTEQTVEAMRQVVGQRKAPLIDRCLRAAGAVLRWLGLWLRHRQLRKSPFIRADSRMTFEFAREGVLRAGHGVHFRGGGYVYCQGELSLGDDVFLNQGVYLSAYHSVTIGSHVRFGERVSIHDENHVYGAHRRPVDDWATYTVRPVVIEDGVWLGANVVVLPGTFVGRNTVVGAGAVLRGTYPPDSVVVGNPGTVIRSHGDGLG